MNLLHELKYAIRNLAREPLFGALCILVLALGIGANTAIFSIVNGVLLQQLPYREPEQLVSLREIIPAVAANYPTLPVSARHFVEWKQRSTSFVSIAAHIVGTGNLTGAGEPERLQTARVSANFLDTLGVQPALGRGFVPGEDVEGQDRVVVISSGLWERRFQADPAIAGKTIMLDSVPCTIVGVLPPRFQYPSTAIFESGPMTEERPEVLRPVVFSENELRELMGQFNYPAVARLKPGVGREAARAELNIIASQLEKTAGEKVNLQAAVFPLQESMVGRSRRGLVMLLCAVGAVLLIACVNLANVMLARAERKGREWSIRSALGASGAHLVREVLAETALIALTGGLLAITLASAGLGVLVRHVPADVPRLNQVTMDMRVLLFSLTVTLATGLLFGLGPAWRCTRSKPQEALKAGGRTATGARQGMRFRQMLVSAEVGLSAALLILAALLGISFMKVLRSDKGFRAPTVLAADVAIPLSKYREVGQRDHFYEEVLARLQSHAGIHSAAISTALPLTGETWIDSAWVPGDPRPPVERPVANVRFVSQDYLKTMGIPLLAGRTFSERDRKRKVAILSERFAAALWPGQDPLGRFLTRGDERLEEVIGIAGDVRADPDKPAVAMIYRPYWDWSPRHVTLIARAQGDPLSIASILREAIRSVDRDVPVPAMRTMQEILAESVAQRRFQMLLSLSFAVMALLLAALGIYGVVSYATARRTPEMGIRAALGAQVGQLRRMMLRQAMTPVLAGLFLGAAAALATRRFLGSMLYGVTADDPVIIAAVMALLAAVALAASWAPIRQATRADPLEVLRYE